LFNMIKNKESYFNSFMLYCIGRLNLSPNFINDNKKNEIITYLKYIKSNGGKVSLKEIERIIKDERIKTL